VTESHCKGRCQYIQSSNPELVIIRHGTPDTRQYNAILNYCRDIQGDSKLLWRFPWSIIFKLETCHERRACWSCVALCIIDSRCNKNFLIYNLLFREHFYFVSCLKIIDHGKPPTKIKITLYIPTLLLFTILTQRVRGYSILYSSSLTIYCGV
jgi:hypothetical protein